MKAIFRTILGKEKMTFDLVQAISSVNLEGFAIRLFNWKPFLTLSSLIFVALADVLLQGVPEFFSCRLLPLGHVVEVVVPRAKKAL